MGGVDGYNLGDVVDLAHLYMGKVRLEHSSFPPLFSLPFLQNVLFVERTRKPSTAETVQDFFHFPGVGSVFPVR